MAITMSPELSTGAAAQPAGRYDPPDNAETPIVSTRDQYNDTWSGDAEQKAGVGDTDYDTSGDVPGVDTDCPDELMVYVHGFNNTESAAAENFNDAEHSLRENGYDGAFTGFSWDSNPGPTEFGEAHNRAEDNGCKLGKFLLDFRCECPDATLHIAAHSLGAVVVKHTMQWLKNNDKWDQKGSGIIESVHLLGAAIAETMPAQCKSLIECIVGEFHNYWNWDDDILSGFYPYGEALGETGAQGKKPDNYTDHDVADEVGDDHSGYNGDEESDDDGVIDEVKENMDAAKNVQPSVERPQTASKLPTESELDGIVTKYNSSREQYPFVDRLFGDEKVNLYVVEPAPPGYTPDYDVREQPVLGSFAFTFENARIVSWQTGAASKPSMNVYATKRALTYITTSSQPFDALQEERQDGNIAIKGRDPVTQFWTGSSTYAVDTQRTVVRGWERVISVVQLALPG